MDAGSDRRLSAGWTRFVGERAPLVVYLLFTLASAIGYAVFGRHPELMAGRPDLLAFYAASFRWLARAHVLIGAGVLTIYLVRRSGFVWIPALVGVYFLSLGSELVGTTTGFPFGEYAYSSLLGWKWFDHVPALIPVSWFTMALPAYLISRRRYPTETLRRIFFGAVILTAWDLALDPAMSYVTNYWTWGNPGAYYGMPAVNLFGWMLTGIAIMLLLEVAGVRRWGDSLSARWNAAFYLVTLLMPLLLLAAAGEWVAVLISSAVAGGCFVLAFSGAGLEGHRRATADDQDDRIEVSNGRAGPAFDTIAPSAGDGSARKTFVASAESPKEGAAGTTFDTSVASSRDGAARKTFDISAASSRDGTARKSIHAAPAEQYVRARALNVSEAEASGELRRFFARNSLSFSFAARWFAATDRHHVARLYAYCRITDDLADEDPHASPEDIRGRLRAWMSLTRLAYEGGDSGVPWLDTIMTHSRVQGVPIELAEDLVRGVVSDVGSVRIQSWAELEKYTFRVASVVGIWMCYLFGVKDITNQRRAAALGQAMQLTNILRDVGEDLRLDRIYIPSELMARYDLDEHALQETVRQRRIPAPYKALTLEMMGRAEALYAFAEPGLAELPPAFGHAASVASGVYRAIHREIVRNEFDNLTLRASTGLLTKIVAAVKSLSRLRRARRRAIMPIVAVSAPARKAARATSALVLAALLGGTALPGLARPTEIATTGPRSALVDRCPPLDEIRAGYIEAVESREIARRTLELIRAQPCDRVVFTAYEGALLTLHAKHARWPPRKLSYTNEGLAILDRTVEDHPDHIEVRYLRLLSCYFLPGFFGRKDSVRKDLKVLADLLPPAAHDFPSELYIDMVRFVLGTADLTLEQESALRDSLERSS